MPTFVLSSSAEADIGGICEYIAARNIAGAVDVLDRLERTCQMLAENPGLGENRKGFGVPGCRSFTVSRYVIFFRPTKFGVDIARILDASRDL
jgi:toxin ParE1/3/4